MFSTMNSSYITLDFEPGHNPGQWPAPVRDFLCRFDKIFTLNQCIFVLSSIIKKATCSPALPDDGSPFERQVCKKLSLTARHRHTQGPKLAV